MATSNGIKIVYGAASISSRFGDTPPGFETYHDYSGRVLEILKEKGVTTIDTAELYFGSEEEIAYHKGAEHFVIDSKLRGGAGEGRNAEQIVAAGKARLDALNAKQLDILYVHMPEKTIPVEEQTSGLNELYKQGAFKRLGISNFTAEQAQEFYEAAKKNGHVVPTVYQGAYSAASRRSEKELLPTLRKLGISYYAYSPIAGGFLAKTRQQILDGVGRFDKTSRIGAMYNGLYNKPVYLDLLDKWEKIAEGAGISKAELAYRWATYHSILDGEKGDGIIFGAKNPDQLTETIDWIRAGPLSAEVAGKVDDLWEGVEHEAPLDNVNSKSK